METVELNGDVSCTFCFYQKKKKKGRRDKFRTEVSPWVTKMPSGCRGQEQWRRGVLDVDDGWKIIGQLVLC